VKDDSLQNKDYENRTSGHRKRLRYRFIEGGIDRFSDEEVIEFLLTLGTPRKDVKIPARKALKKYGGLSAVLSASPEELKEIKGIGDKNVLYLKLIHDVAGRYLRDRVKGSLFLSSSKAVYEYLFHSMRDIKREIFKVIFLNRKNALISDRDVFQGSLTGSAVYPAEIMKLALNYNAAGLVFVHNHPSGDPGPSGEDKNLTRKLVWASQMLSIQVLDHIIIGNNVYYSFADEGLIKYFYAEYKQKIDV
jgi:DNA repair protein RadC